MKARINKVTIQIIQDDIFSQTAGGIVNPTDTNLHVSPTLAEKAGPAVQRACAAIGWCETGYAVATDAGSLPFEKIIHAVGPRWGEGSERGKLASVTLECLRLAEKNRLKSVALPAISVGVLGYPAENCAKTMLSQIIDFTFEDLKYLRTIIICLDDPVVYQIFKDEFAEQIKDLKEAGDGEVKV
ncbi:MAG: macro domain-containing protein [Chloroflexi bacterium]|nr:macro domain-containing protein [Chloroflexota bacterium]